MGTFKEVFYSLLSPSLRMQIKRVDEEAALTKADLESIKARLQDKGLNRAEKAALRKQKSVLIKRLRVKKRHCRIGCTNRH